MSMVGGLQVDLEHVLLLADVIRNEVSFASNNLEQMC